MSTVRTMRISQLIREEISKLLLHETNDPELRDIVVTDVKVTHDLKLASIYYTVPDKGKEKRVALRFKKAEPFFRRRLKTLNLRYVPELKFLLDSNRESVYRVFTILDEISRERRENV